jgi:hypothetical protein
LSSFDHLLAGLTGREVRFVVIGVWGANYWARSAGTVFTTQDRDLFLPPDPVNLLAAWQVARASGYELWSGAEPLGEPLDLWLAEKVVEHRAGVKALARGDADPIEVDLTLVMAGFEFEEVWRECRRFRVEGVDVPVARLAHIARSKSLVDRPKDRLFLATYEDTLRALLADDRG